MLVRQLEEELRIRSLQNPGHEVRQQVEAMYAENDHLSREVAILRETVKVSQETSFFRGGSTNSTIILMNLFLIFLFSEGTRIED